MNNLNSCYFCNVDLDKKSVHPKFFRCPACGTMYRTNQKEMSEYIDGAFRKDYEQQVKQILNNDRGHYMRMNSRPDFNFLVEKLQIRKIFSFGGGLPKLESFFHSEYIIVYDLNTDIYQSSFLDFKHLYPIGETPVLFETARVNATLIKSIPANTYDMFTFVHFLEHIDASQVKSILDAIPPGIRVLIYQPNVSRGNRSNWFHYSDQHITLVSGSKMREFVMNWYGASIELYAEIDEDFLLVFSK